MSLLKKNNDLGLFILRVSISILMLFHGSAKLASGCAGVKGMLAAQDLPEFIAYGVLIGEVVAPLLILIGFRTRLSALVLAFNCLVAILLGHGDHLFSMSEYGGWAAELPALYLFPALVLFFTGAGKWAWSHSNKWD